MTTTAVRRSTYGKLSADTTLTGLLGTPAAGYTKAIYHAQAPAAAAHPFVLINKQSGVPTEAMGDPTALQTDVWLVKAVDQSGSADRAEAIQARIQTLLNDARLSISGATHLYLRRMSDVQYTEVEDGVTYQHAGGLYRLVTDPT